MTVDEIISQETTTTTNATTTPIAPSASHTAADLEAEATPKCDNIEALGRDLEEAWTEELSQRGRSGASLTRALLKCFGAHLFVAALWEIVGKCFFGVSVAVTLGLLIGDIQSLKAAAASNSEQEQELLRWGWDSLQAMIIYKSLILFLCMGGNILASQYYLFHSTYVGMKCRLACTYLIYRKALRISLVTLESTTSGQIMNLITNDVNKFDTASFYLQYIYIAPIQTLLIFILLAFFYMSFAATLIGFSLVGVYLVIQVHLGRAFGRYRAESTVKSDERVRLTGELVDAIGIIKMYAWEDFFERNIKKLRDAELGVLKRVMTLRAINLSLFYGACKLVLMVILVAYVLMGNTFSAVKVFTAITMTNSMRTYLTLFFPYSIAQVSEMKISLERIRQFLTQEELDVGPALAPATVPRDLSIRGAKFNLVRPSILITPTAVAPAAASSAAVASTPTLNNLSPAKQPTVSQPSVQSMHQPTLAVAIVPALTAVHDNSQASKSSDKPEHSAHQHQKPTGATGTDPCGICSKFDNNRLLIDRKFAIIFHEVSACWPKPSSVDNDGGGRGGGSSPGPLPPPPLSRQSNNSGRGSSWIFNNLTAHIKHHEFVMIVGRVGSGKSTLLMSLLNELPIQAGSIRINGSLSYASQEPWLFAGTIRENITIAWHKQPGRDYRHMPSRLERRYREVLRICCLDRDLAALPNGDLTPVGERGSTLSGGQKARVNLARALFYDADIYLLDDPLSAVDASVARYIFDECFKTFLKRKTVLLVTHQVQLSAPAQKVLLLHDSPDFSYGPATRVLHNLLKQYNLDPKAAEPQPSGTTEERAVVPVTVTEAGAATSGPKRELSPVEPPLGEIESNSLSQMKSLNSDELLQGINSLDDGSSSTAISDGQRPVGLQKSVTRSPSLRMIAGTSDDDGKDQPADLDTYLYYRRKAAAVWLVGVFLLTNLVTQLLFNGTDYFLSEWLNVWNKIDTKLMCAFYLGIVILLLLASFGRNTIFFRSCSRASEQIHQESFRGVLYAPMSFFDHNSIGSILARFSTDLSTLDDLIPQTAIDVIEISTNVLGIIVVTAIVSVYNIIPAIIILLVANYLRSSSERAITMQKKLEAIKRGQVFSYLVSTLHGLITIRVFRLESVINRRFESAQNEHTSAWYSFLAGRHRLTQSIDAACMVYFFSLLAIILTFVFVGLIDANMVGLLISQVIILPGPLQWGARQITELQSLMTSVMRIKEYVSLRNEREDPSAAGPRLKPPPGWPKQGTISYEGVTLSYVDGTDVLHNVSFEVKVGERVGIVGRTGAGKSSIISALFRMTDFKGKILIDGIDTQSIGLTDLRRAISIIPQEPILFSGTVRRNLDPFDEYSDDAIWSALEAVQLKRVFLDLHGGLEGNVAEGGQNFSVGQRQLICLARVILRRNRVLVLDEATANVDPETDLFIQKTIRELFKDCTVMTIAHRLNTIMDSDRVLVLDAGEVCEFDEPHVLLTRGGHLATMIANTGQQADRLRRVAERAYNKRHDQY